MTSEPKVPHVNGTGGVLKQTGRPPVKGGNSTSKPGAGCTDCGPTNHGKSTRGRGTAANKLGTP